MHGHRSGFWHVAAHRDDGSVSYCKHVGAIRIPVRRYCFVAVGQLAFRINLEPIDGKPRWYVSAPVYCEQHAAVAAVHRRIIDGDPWATSQRWAQHRRRTDIHSGHATVSNDSDIGVRLE